MKSLLPYRPRRTTAGSAALLATLLVAGIGGPAHLLAQTPQVFRFDLLQKASEQFDGECIANTAGIAVFGKAEGIEDVAVTGEDAMAAEGIGQLFAFGCFVRERAIVRTGETQVMGHFMPQQVVTSAGQVQRPIVIADHIMRADRDRHFVVVGHRLTITARERHGHEAFGGEGPQLANDLDILTEDFAGDAADHFDAGGRLQIAPGADIAAEPPLRTNEVEHIAQQYQVETLNRLIAAVRPPASAIRR